jgi:hypothetical protein
MDDPGVVVRLDRGGTRDARVVTGAWLRELALVVAEDPSAGALEALRRAAGVGEIVGEPGAPLRDHHGALTEGHAADLELVAGEVQRRWSAYADDAREERDASSHPEVAGYCGERAGHNQRIADAAERLLAALSAAG